MKPSAKINAVRGIRSLQAGIKYGAFCRLPQTQGPICEDGPAMEASYGNQRVPCSRTHV